MVATLCLTRHNEQQHSRLKRYLRTFLPLLLFVKTCQTFFYTCNTTALLKTFIIYPMCLPLPPNAFTLKRWRLQNYRGKIKSVILTLQCLQMWIHLVEFSMMSSVWWIDVIIDRSSEMHIKGIKESKVYCLADGQRPPSAFGFAR